jgi:chromosome segregation protein
MRLKQIKLAGFKSFVDPTTVPFPDNLTAILGPNGCGKSNIIDAVRWVMGESSAKHLRGDSMTDVIFNGSNKRKPVGQASVELVFDNAEGKLQGEYASYSEIAIRRVVTRDSQNSYFLNNTRCRRKDITGIFLGTGLGPRSYAIIEQGMISRLIESKPHELRTFIEEAAGISKYKERRKETETRIRHTRENLERLSDLRDELGKQLAHLQRQAAAAERFKEFKKDERQLKAELAAIKWVHLDKNVNQLNQVIDEMNVELEAKHAVLTDIQARGESNREQHTELTDKFNAIQGKYYGVGAEISRIEQTIRHTKERKQQLQVDIQRNQESISQAKETLISDQEKRFESEEQLLEIEPMIEECLLESEEAAEQLEEAESSMIEWQEAWDLFNNSAAGTQQQAQIEQTKIQHSESILEKIRLRSESINQEITSLDSEHAEFDVATSEALLGELEIQLETLTDSVLSIKAQIEQEKQEKSAVQFNVEQRRKDLRVLETDFIKLKAKQEAVLSHDNELSQQWLNRHHLDSHKKLAQKIEVDSGWEKAAEVVLDKYLDAVCINDVGQWLETFSKDTPVALSFVADTKISNKLTSDTANDIQLNPAQILSDNVLSEKVLSEKVKGHSGLDSYLSQIFIAEDLEVAHSLLPNIQSHQSIVTKEGIWLSASWIRFAHTNDEISVIERQKLLDGMDQDLEQQTEKFESLEAQLIELSEALDSKVNDLERKQDRLNELTQEKNRAQTEVTSQQLKLADYTQRKKRLETELNDLLEQQQLEQTQVQLHRGKLEQIVENMGNDEAHREQLQSKKEYVQGLLENAKSTSQLAKDKYHQYNLQSERIKTDVRNLIETENRLQKQIVSLEERQQDLHEKIAEDIEPTDELQIQLEEALQTRVEAENELSEARDALSGVEQSVRKMEQERLQAEHQAEAIRLRIEKLRIDNQEYKVRRAAQEDYLKDQKYDRETLVHNLDEDATEESHQQLLSQVSDRVNRLGAINLAAIEEYQTQSARKQYLDEQDEDLNKALETLENAIRKIDRETRTRFKETFEKVNKGLQELFPKVFGGGHAYLEMTGDDLLDTGVTIMARPPGKRNSTIHLLSGGEKALTAIALVFSIFQLNPAPFCMLDEVDAPLDDANVGRYCTLVKEMSKQVQFIYISHNKQAMEMAMHLMGVTMQEGGVSRLVSVDLEEATELAEAAGH